MNTNEPHIFVRFLTSVSALVVVVLFGGWLSGLIAAAGAQSWMIWSFALLYTIGVVIGYLALKRTRLGKYIWTLPDGITW